MTEYEKLIKMNEGDGADEDILDLLFFCYLNEEEFRGYCVHYVTEGKRFDALKYTNSLDALKAVRDEELEGFTIYINEHSNGVNCILNNEGNCFSSRDLPTEYRAIMHATASAIEWKRSQ